jgi:hypothetical protein
MVKIQYSQGRGTRDGGQGTALYSQGRGTRDGGQGTANYLLKGLK